MLDIKNDLYEKAFRQWNMTPIASERPRAQAGCSYRMDNEEGSGEYWVYSRDNFFAVSAFRIEFKSQGIMRFRHTEHLSVSYYDKAGLIAKARTATPRPGTVSTYIASEGNEYVARFSPGSTVQATSITVSPDYYRTYLHERFGNIPDMRKAFLLVDGRPDCPELIALFKQIKRYRGAGMAADLFYEGAVAEALALIIKRASEIEEEDAGRESALPPLDDRKSLDNVGSFIRNNLSANLTCNVLAHRACMGQTKFKATFKSYFGASPNAFVTEARMEEAAELLRTTNMPVADIAAKVGYRKPAAFAEAFRRHTGIAPSAMRGKRMR